MEKEKPTIILMMRETPERAELTPILERFAEVVALFTKSDVLNYVKNHPAVNIAMLIGDFSDPAIDAWDILEPLKIVLKNIPLYVVAAENDTSYQEMINERVAGVFTRPLSLDILAATIEMELKMPPPSATNHVGRGLKDKNFRLPVEMRTVVSHAATCPNTPETSAAELLHRQLIAFAANKGEIEKIATAFYRAKETANERQAAKRFAGFNEELTSIIQNYRREPEIGGAEK